MSRRRRRADRPSIKARKAAPVAPPSLADVRRRLWAELKARLEEELRR